MKTKVRRTQRISVDSFSISLAIAFLALALGILSGCVFAGKVNSSTLSNLINTDVLSLTNGETADYSFLSSFLNFAKYPAILLFLSFSAFGTTLIPCAVFSKGFFLSLSAASLICTFGKNGFLPAIALFGFGALVSIPCTLFFASVTFEFSKPFALLLYPSKSKLRAGHMKTSSLILLFVVMLVFVLLTAFLDSLITPKILPYTLKNIL